MKLDGWNWATSTPLTNDAMNPPRNEPATPRRMVMISPIDCRSGSTKRAIAPTTKPNTIQPRMLVIIRDLLLSTGDWIVRWPFIHRISRLPPVLAWRWPQATLFGSHRFAIFAGLLDSPPHGCKEAKP